jgi:hypothetical protein
MAQSTLVVMPTGTGKTVCLGQIVSQWPSGRVMVIAHREELIGQLSRTISLMSGETCGVEMAEESVYEGSYWRPRVVVASVQTLNSRRGGKKRLEKFDPQEFGLVVTDEAHHGVARVAPAWRHGHRLQPRQPAVRPKPNHGGHAAASPIDHGEGAAGVWARDYLHGQSPDLQDSCWRLRKCCYTKNWRYGA